MASNKHLTHEEDNLGRKSASNQAFPINQVIASLVAFGSSDNDLVSPEFREDTMGGSYRYTQVFKYLK
ncbi:hypothetical protein [Candidatus Parabeggiatoa sp. HSG14]|uniref:hypothetical protein n=1 Tax=Candidatus Parabeggiatoa sp. HSG14 TaxID=3055593 RepID=UPI0025A71620|nr:hypothetical protein [Thiotrichales bacterium HSG14]